jgi:hypothetical protein
LWPSFVFIFRVPLSSITFISDFENGILAIWKALMLPQFCSWNQKNEEKVDLSYLVLKESNDVDEAFSYHLFDYGHE